MVTISPSPHRLRSLLRAAAPALGACLFLCASCANEVGSASLALTDPLSLLDDLTSPLQLRVVPGSDYTCIPALGSVTPDARAAVAQRDAVVDIALPVTNDETTLDASAEIELLPGEWVVTAYADAVDSMSSAPISAGGCTTVVIGAGETRDAAITLRALQTVGQCGDGTLGPTEQCDDGNQDSGDGCSEACAAETINATTMPEGTQRDPVVAWSPSSRGMVMFTAPEFVLGARYLGVDGQVLSAPNHLTIARDLESGVAPVTPVAAQGGPRTFVSYQNGTAVEVVHFTQNADGEDYITDVLDTTVTGVERCSKPAVAVRGDGAALVLAECATMGGEATVAGLLYAAGESTPTPLTSLGLSNVTVGTMALAARGDSYLLVYLADGSLMAQPISATGEAMGEASSLASPGSNSRPAFSSISSGQGLVAYQGADGTIRGTLLAPDGSVASSDLALSDGPGSAPSVAGGDSHFVVTWEQTGVRARFFDQAGSPTANRVNGDAASFEIAASGSSHIRTASSGNLALFSWWDQGATNGDVLMLTLPLP